MIRAHDIKLQNNVTYKLQNLINNSFNN